MAVLDIPEVLALNAASNLIRIPNQLDVPVTQRIMEVIDSRPFQRLKRVSQLGLVSRVYPAANHTRFEHSLGVYRMALLVVRQLGSHQSFAKLVSEQQGTALLLAALLHDIGHWPYCHPIEDMRLKNIPAHESLARKYLTESSLSTFIEQNFQLDPELVLRLIERSPESPVESLLCSILSGPIDVDKLDYLYRDSLHAGVPYGQNFDAGRLISSLCLNRDQTKLAITQKGRTAAELMVFARYVMFSEVYWHHAVRSATSMLQRAFYLLYQKSSETCLQLFRMDEREFETSLLAFSRDDESADLVRSLFGDRRGLYKRLAAYSFMENPGIYRSLAQQPFVSLVKKSRELGVRIQSQTGISVGPNDIIIDAPPVGLEVQFNVDVYFPKQRRHRSLGDVSPVVNTLAKRQFDDFVKQVRIFVHPELSRQLPAELDIESLLESVVGQE